MASLERGRVPSPRPVAGRKIPLINRLEEMKLLKDAVDTAVQGEGGVVFLYGKAGIGKRALGCLEIVVGLWLLSFLSFSACFFLFDGCFCPECGVFELVSALFGFSL